MKLSIIIVNYNARELLETCVASIYRYPPGEDIDFEIIVVDNNSSDGSADMVRGQYPGVRLVINDRNIGFAAANNIGVRIAEGEYILLLNSDAEFLPSSAGIMINYLDENPAAGIAGPKLLDKNKESIQRSWWWSPTIMKEAFQKFMATRYIIKYPAVKTLVNMLEVRRREVELVTGACMLIRKSVFDGVGMLDENLFLYFEEPDFCKRAHACGWKVVFLPDAKIIHNLGQSMRKIGYESRLQYVKSQLYYYRKHNSRFQQILLKCYLMIKYAMIYLAGKDRETTRLFLDIVRKYPPKAG